MNKRQFMNLSSEEITILFEVSCNPVLKKCIQFEMEDLNRQLTEFSPEGFTPEAFVVEYRVTKDRKNILNEFQIFLEDVYTHFKQSNESS